MSRLRYGTFRFQGLRERQASTRAAAAAGRARSKAAWGPASRSRVLPWTAGTANGLPPRVAIDFARCSEWSAPPSVAGERGAPASPLEVRGAVAASASGRTLVLRAWVRALLESAVGGDRDEARVAAVVRRRVRGVPAVGPRGAGGTRGR